MSLYGLVRSAAVMLAVFAFFAAAFWTGVVLWERSHPPRIPAAATLQPSPHPVAPRTAARRPQ